MDDTHQSDSDALASALGAIGAGADGTTHHFHHQLQQPDFSQPHKSPMHVEEHHVDVHGLDIPVHGEDEVDLHGGDDLDLGMMDGHDDDLPQRTNNFGRPPSIRKACDLCHAAKQRCTGERPSCVRCAAGGWACVYAPRQRRRTVPKDQKHAMSTPPEHHDHSASMSLPPQPMSHHHHQGKKRKLGGRDSLGGFGSGEMDMKMAMGMAVDLGLTGEEEGEEMMSMTDDQMLESIAIDGYLADLPLATFVHNLPYTAGSNNNDNNYNGDDYSGGNDNTFPSAADMDQHTTSALRDAIFSLNESSGANTGQDGTGDHDGEGHGDGEAMDPHLALLDLSHAMPVEGENETGDGTNDHLNLNFGPSACPHVALVLHILNLLTQQNLEPKPGSNTPLTLSVFAPLARSLRLFHALVHCPSCSSSPQQTLPQLALLSRTTTILTFPYPSISSSSVGSSAQITVHGARLSGTGLSEAIEQHIVGVVWDSWRASIREIFANLERKAQEVITQSTVALTSGNGEGAGGAASGAETQRAGLMFQAMSRLVTAMDEVEDN